MTKQFTHTSRSAKVVAGLAALAVGVVPFVGVQPWACARSRSWAVLGNSTVWTPLEPTCW